MTIEQPHDFQDDSQAAGPGQLLRNAREQLGWTREQVASRIHLRLTLIAAIESDTYDKHTSHTFIRGYLRTYAKLVGIPDETILAAYEKLGLTPPDNIDMQSFSRRSRQQANDSRLKLVTWLVILVLIALSVAWWWQNSSRRSAGDDALAATEMSSAGQMPSATVAPADEVAEPIAATDSVSAAPAPVSAEPMSAAPVPAESVSAATPQPVATPASAAVVTTVTEPAPAQGNPSSANPALVAAPSSAIPAAASAAVVTAAEPSAALATEPASTPQLKMSFTADCWLEVKDSNGKVLFSGLKRANDILVLAGAEPIKFNIGAPMAVNIEYQGKSIDMSRYNNGRTARLSLPQE